MSKYKIKDNKNKKDLGILHVDFVKLANNLKPRIVAGVCFTLMIGSTLGVVAEVLDNAEEVYKESRAQTIIQMADESLISSAEHMVAHMRVEIPQKECTQEIDARMAYLSGCFNEMDGDAEIVSNEQYVSLKNEFLVIREPEHLNVELMDDPVTYSDMVMVRDKLRDICDSVKEILEQMKKDKDIGTPPTPKDDKKRYPYGDSPRDIFYKEPLDTGRRL